MCGLIYLFVITRLIFLRPSSSTSIHRREGAFSPSDDIPAEPAVAPGSTLATRPLESLNIENNDTAVDVFDKPDALSVTVIEPPSRRTTLPPEIDHHKFSQWLRSNPELSLPLENRRVRKGGSVDGAHYKQRLSLSPQRRSMSPEASEAPSPPPKNFRNSLTKSLKRLSINRTASLSSKSGRRWSGGTHYSSRTPSPSLRRASPPAQVPKMRSTNPAALFCHEVHSQRTTSERCLIYATKINELHHYDCGLSEWVINMKSRGLSPYSLFI